MEKLLKFIAEHYADDVSRLILDRKKYPEIDIDLAVNCIESRRKLKGKVQEWHDNPSLIFPFIVFVYIILHLYNYMYSRQVKRH